MLGRTFIADRIDAEELMTNGGYWGSVLVCVRFLKHVACDWGDYWPHAYVNELSPSGTVAALAYSE